MWLIEECRVVYLCCTERDPREVTRKSILLCDQKTAMNFIASYIKRQTPDEYQELFNDKLRKSMAEHALAVGTVTISELDCECGEFLVINKVSLNTQSRKCNGFYQLHKFNPLAQLLSKEEAV